MNWLTKWAIQLNLTGITPNRVEKWIREENTELLLFCIKKARYPERIQAIKGLRQLEDEAVIPALISIGQDDFEVVAKEALLAIQALDSRSQYQAELDRMNEFWERKEQRRKTKTNKPAINFIDKSHMKNLEHLKKQLKTPMIGGKWF